MSTVVGNALHLPFADDTFDGIVTSPCYGNRMADSHHARDDSRRNTYTHSGRHPAKFSDEILDAIRGTLPPTDMPVLDPFAGVGRIHQLPLARAVAVEIEPEWAQGGIRDTTRELHPQNSGGMQWGGLYRAFHEAAWKESTRVARRFFILNISNHIRAGKEQMVTQWHVSTLVKLGWRPQSWHRVDTPRLRYGQNHESRVGHEWVILLIRE